MRDAVCPTCGARHPAAERFCPSCRVPLVFDADKATAEPVSEAHRRARKIKPQLSEGQLVRVAGARNQAEGEFIQALLLEEGVPSLLKRTAGFDVPDFLAAGPRDVLVPQSGEDVARDVLLAHDPAPDASTRHVPRPARIFAGLLLGVIVVALVIVVVAAVAH